MKTYATFLVLLFIAGLAGCNTISGAGQDVKAAGKAVEETAENVKDEMTDDDDEVLD